MGKLTHRAADIAGAPAHAAPDLLAEVRRENVVSLVARTAKGRYAPAVIMGAILVLLRNYVPHWQVAAVAVAYFLVLIAFDLHRQRLYRLRDLPGGTDRWLRDYGVLVLAGAICWAAVALMLTTIDDAGMRVGGAVGMIALCMGNVIRRASWPPAVYLYNVPVSVAVAAGMAWRMTLLDLAIAVITIATGYAMYNWTNEINAREGEQILARLAKEAAQREAEHQRRLLQTLFDTIDQGVEMVDADLNVVAENRRMRGLMGLPAPTGGSSNRLEDRVRLMATRGDFGSGDIDALVQRELDAARNGSGEFLYRLGNGNIIEAHRFQLAGGGHVTVYSDVTERVSLMSELETLATLDALTGALNRRSFLEGLNREIGRSDRFAHPLSLLMIDLDHFKSINDRFGHAGGDTALKEFARLCRDRLRIGDLFGRLGGEEFAILLPETALDAAIAVAQRLRADFERIEIAPTPDAVITCRVSIGVAQRNESGESAESLTTRADRALYRAKNNGRNRVESET